MGIFSSKKNKTETRASLYQGAFADLNYRFGNGTEYSALGQSAIYGAINLISGDLSSLPLKVYERADNGRQRIPLTDKSYLPYLLGHKPNPYQDTVSFFKTATAHYLLHRNVYVLKQKNMVGEVVELHLIHPSLVTIEFINNKKYYTFNSTTYTDLEIIHIFGLSTDGIKGISLLQVANEAIQTNGFLQKFAGKFFANNATPSGILMYEEKLTKEGKERIKDDWESRYRGVDNQHKIAVFDANVKFQQLSANAKDSQLIEQRAFSVLEICRLFNLSPSKLGDLSKSSYASLEQSNLDYWTSTLRPIATAFETAFNVGLVPNQYLTLRYVEFDYSSLVKTDSEKQTQLLDMQLKAGIITLNQALESLNRNTIGEAGDIRFIPQNVAIQKTDGTIVPVNQIEVKK